MTITLDPITTGTPAPPELTTTRRAWARIGAATGILAAVTFFGFGVLTVDESALADNTLVHQAVLDKEIAVWLFQTATSLVALGLVVFGAGLHRRLARHEPADSLVPLVAAAGVFLTAGLTLVGGGISTEMFWSLAQDAEKVDPDTIGAHLAIYNTLAWVWAGLGFTMGAVGWAARRNPDIPRWIGRVSIAAAALVALTQLVPLQYLAVVPGILWLVAVGVGFARTDRHPA